MYIVLLTLCSFVCRYVDDWGYRIQRNYVGLDHLLLATRKHGKHLLIPPSTMNVKQPQSSHQLFFYPTEHPDNTLKAFTEFIQTFQLRYTAQFPDPPKTSLDTALHRWKILNTSETAPDPKPTIVQYDKLVSDW